MSAFRSACSRPRPCYTAVPSARLRHPTELQARRHSDPHLRQHTGGWPSHLRAGGGRAPSRTPPWPPHTPPAVRSGAGERRSPHPSHSHLQLHVHVQVAAIHIVQLLGLAHDDRKPSTPPAAAKPRATTARGVDHGPAARAPCFCACAGAAILLKGGKSGYSSTLPYTKMAASLTLTRRRSQDGCAHVALTSMAAPMCTARKMAASTGGMARWLVVGSILLRDGYLSHFWSNVTEDIQCSFPTGAPSSTGFPPSFSSGYDSLDCSTTGTVKENFHCNTKSFCKPKDAAFWQGRDDLHRAPVFC